MGGWTWRERKGRRTGVCCKPYSPVASSAVRLAASELSYWPHPYPALAALSPYSAAHKWYWERSGKSGRRERGREREKGKEGSKARPQTWPQVHSASMLKNGDFFPTLTVSSSSSPPPPPPSFSSALTLLSTIRSSPSSPASATGVASLAGVVAIGTPLGRFCSSSSFCSSVQS